MHPAPLSAHSLGSCHRLGLTGKRKHNQKDNVIMPQCGTIYTKTNTTKKSTFLASSRPPSLILHPPPHILHPFSTFLCCCCFSLPGFGFGFGFSAFSLHSFWSLFLCLQFLPFFCCYYEQDPLFLQLPSERLQMVKGRREIGERGKADR